MGKKVASGWTKKRAAGVVFAALAFFMVTVSVYGANKPLPEGISFEGDIHDGEVSFLTDVTYPGFDGEAVHEQVIFDEVHSMIEEAEDFILVDMFLFNDEYERVAEYPRVSGELVEALVGKKEAEPHMEIVVITDPINTFYGSYFPESLAALEDAGIRLVLTDLSELRDSNPVYSGVWRTGMQWFGNKEDGGWLPNPFSPDSPDGTVRSYMKLLNFKANHRKVIVTEQQGLVTSANPHDASGYHSNIAFTVTGGILEDLIESEKAVAVMSGAEENWFDGFQVSEDARQSEGAETRVQLVTEGKIREGILEEIALAGEGDTVYLGAFYLSDRLVVEALLDAAGRSADVRVILDANKDAFGREKNGVPNRPVAHELIMESDWGVEVKWYNTQGEQFHTKLVMIERGDESVVIGGSSNFTKRNLGDLNLETNLKVMGASDSEVMKDVRAYFDLMWMNEEAQFTVGYEEFADDSLLNRWLYRFQEWSGLSTF
ncbi:phospholipase [Alteribacter keqinensis]|uniref:phospholipase D n=2 Tax=Alteribacter keqinensis TaxID=2483800 RepID=A0A3M7U1U5_9BACI|nr:phospholipase [Alteribacter keqinensis]